MSKKIVYTTEGTCSKAIEVELDDAGRIASCSFLGGCPGNTAGVSLLVRGMKPEDVIEKFRGLRCGARSTSCPDQLSRALEQLTEA